MTKTRIQSSAGAPTRDEIRERILDAAERLLERRGVRLNHTNRKG